MPKTPPESVDPAALKEAVRDHWSREPCGTREVPAADRRAFFAQLESERYALEPHIPRWARWERARGCSLLEIGVGAGTDFVQWVRHGAHASGVDLTEEAVALVRERLELEGLTADLRVADAEALPFEDDRFDFVYSYGVIHHTPDPPRALAEVYRVLRPGGTALVMLYNLHSWTAWNLWAFHALARGRPWMRPRQVVARHLESPGTHAYTARETRALFRDFEDVRMRTALLAGDLLAMRRSAKYQGAAARLVFALYPRALIRALGPRFGFARWIEARKPGGGPP